MQEYEHFDGENFITFDIVSIDDDETEVYVAVTKLGKISFVTYELWEDADGLYFLYGPCEDEIHLNDFEELDEHETYT